MASSTRLYRQDPTRPDWYINIDDPTDHILHPLPVKEIESISEEEIDQKIRIVQAMIAIKGYTVTAHDLNMSTKTLKRFFPMPEPSPPSVVFTDDHQCANWETLPLVAVEFVEASYFSTEIREEILQQAAIRPVIYFDCHLSENYLLATVVKMYLELEERYTSLSSKKNFWTNLLRLMIHLAVHIYASTSGSYRSRYRTCQAQMKSPTIESMWQSVVTSIQSDLSRTPLVAPIAWESNWKLEMESLPNLLIVYDYYGSIPTVDPRIRNRFFGFNPEHTYPVFEKLITEIATQYEFFHRPVRRSNE